MTWCCIERIDPQPNNHALADAGLIVCAWCVGLAGSEDFPYKGVIDQLANQSLAQGTNAWTDVDHTGYSITTAGAQVLWVGRTANRG
jgi:hypothetical protein